MSKLENVYQIAAAIRNGDFDEDLSVISSALKDRRSAKSTKTINGLSVGTRVQFNDKVAPKYMIGKKGTVAKINRTRVKVTMDDKSTRFGACPSTPVSIIDIIS